MAPLYFMAFMLTSCLVAGQSPKYALRGQKVFLTPDIIGHPDGILWKHNGNKVVEFNGKEEQVYGPYENRVTMDWVSAELHITDLRFEDSGDYELEVEINRGFRRSLYKLVVIDKVAQPTISCEMIDGGSLNTSGKLACSAETTQPRSLMTFEWKSHGTVQPGPKILIPLGEKHDDEVYTCHVRNPLSSKTATFTAKDCYPDKSSTVALIVSLVCIAVVLLLVGLGIFFCKRHHKVCFAKQDLEKQSPSKGSDNRREHNPLLGRTPTLASTQPLHQLNPEEEKLKRGQVKELRNLFDRNGDGKILPRKPQTGLESNTDEHVKAASPPSSPLRESPPVDLNNVASSVEGDVDADQLTEPAEEKEEEKPKGVKELKRLFEQNGDGKTSPGKPQTGLESNTDEHVKAASPPSSPRNESPSVDLNNVASSDKGDVDADQLTEPAEEKAPQRDPSDSEKANEAAGVSDDTSEDMQADHSVTPEQPEPEGEADEGERAPSAPASAEASPASLRRSPSLEISPTAAPKDTAGEHTEDANSDHITGETAEENARESDSSGEEERNESDDSSEDKQLSTVPEEKGSETKPREQDLNLSQEEALTTSEDNQQETVKPVSEDGSKETEELYLDTSGQPESTPQTKPEDRNTDTSQVSPDAAHAAPDPQEEDKSSHEGESDTAEDKTEAQQGPKEEKPNNESLSEDKEGHKKDGVVA